MTIEIPDNNKKNEDLLTFKQNQINQLEKELEQANQQIDSYKVIIDHLETVFMTISNNSSLEALRAKSSKVNSYFVANNLRAQQGQQTQQQQ